MRLPRKLAVAFVGPLIAGGAALGALAAPASAWSMPPTLRHPVPPKDWAPAGPAYIPLRLVHIGQCAVVDPVTGNNWIAQGVAVYDPSCAPNAR